MGWFPPARISEEEVSNIDTRTKIFPLIGSFRIELPSTLEGKSTPDPTPVNQSFQPNKKDFYFYAPLPLPWGTT
jgi:hypothetical protein